MITEHAKRHATVYQIQCETQNKGKRVASSKRRIRWRFGFANGEAIQQGKTGKDCRGAEHEVVFVWSLNSGKQLILADGHEVHWAKIGKKEKLEVAWDMHGNHKLKVVAESKQFDLLIDGISFSDLPSIYELGTTSDAAVNPRKLRESSRSQSMPDLQTIGTPSPQKIIQQPQQRSPSSSMDMIVFDQLDVVEVTFQQQPRPAPYQRSQSAGYPQPTMPQQTQYHRSQSATFPPQQQQPPQQPVYTWNDAPPAVPQQQSQYRHSWQPQGYSTPQKRGSMGSYASNASSTNPFEALGGYSTPNSLTNYDSDLNDSPLSSALRSLGVELDQQQLTLDDRSVGSVTSNPFDFAQAHHVPNLMAAPSQR